MEKLSFSQKPDEKLFLMRSNIQFRPNVNTFRTPFTITSTPVFTVVVIFLKLLFMLIFNFYDCRTSLFHNLI